MPLNSKLIKHGIDDEEYANACPTIGHQMLAHFSTPTQHNEVLYQTDGKFFAMNPSRRLYVREAFPNEFDIWTTFEAFEQRPKLWILVSLLCEGVHERTPRYRGSKFWKDATSDRDVADVVQAMSLRGGMNIAEWYGYISDQRISKGNAAKVQSKRSVN